MHSASITSTPGVNSTTGGIMATVRIVSMPNKSQTHLDHVFHTTVSVLFGHGFNPDEGLHLEEQNMAFKTGLWQAFYGTWNRNAPLAGENSLGQPPPPLPNMNLPYSFYISRDVLGNIKCGNGRATCLIYDMLSILLQRRDLHRSRHWKHDLNSKFFRHKSH